MVVLAKYENLGSAGLAVLQSPTLLEKEAILKALETGWKAAKVGYKGFNAAKQGARFKGAVDALKGTKGMAGIGKRLNWMHRNRYAIAPIAVGAGVTGAVVS